jgi:hypothetical protein
MKLRYPTSAHGTYTDGGCVSEVHIGDFMVVTGSICVSGALGRKFINSNKMRSKVETPGWPF